MHAPSQPEFTYIETADALQDLIAIMGRARKVALDTEADSLYHYFEKVCLVQLTVERESYVIDPLAGSWYLEELTDRMEDQAEAYFRKIDELGGVIPAIEAGFFQREIAQAAYEYQKAVEKKQRIIVGVNDFVAR